MLPTRRRQRLRSVKSSTELTSQVVKTTPPPVPVRPIEPVPNRPVEASLVTGTKSGETSNNVDDDVLFWKEGLAGATTPSFPPPRETSSKTTPHGHMLGTSCTLEDSNLSQSCLVGLVSAAWAVVLGYHTESQDCVFGLKPNGRSEALPIRLQASFQRTLASIIDEASRWYDRIDGSRKSLEDIQSVSPDAKMACGFQSVIDIRRATSFQNHDPDKDINRTILVECLIVESEMSFSARFDPSVVARSTMRLLLSELEHLVWQMMQPQNSERTLGSLDALSPMGRRLLLQYNRPLPPKMETFTHHLIDQQVSQRPNEIAIHAWDGDLTYAQLQQKSDALAQHLYRLGVRPDVLVPVVFEKSVYSIIALLAVIKAGGGIVPLDPNLPLARLHMIMEDVAASVVVTSPNHRDKVLAGIPTHVVVDEALLTHLSTLRPGEIIHAIAPNPDNALYIIFTSGSTGKPKGVVITHAAFCSSSSCFSKAVFLTKPDARVLQYSSFTFDACMIEIFTTLTVGACICIPSDEDRMNNVVGCIVNMNVNWAILTPSVATLIDPNDVPQLDVLCLAGEALPQELADNWADHVKAVNVYGPTECCILNIISEPRVRGVQSIALGLPRNCAIWIVDDNFEKVLPPNAVGEIIIEGPTLARGYLGDVAKTNAAFIESPEFLKGVVGSSSRVYRTGDLGRLNEDGTVDYFGRKDAQVKIRGQRVELGEIEHHVKKVLDPSLDVVVELLKLGDGQVLIVAAFVAKKGVLRSASESSRVPANEIIIDNQDPAAKEILDLTLGVREELTKTTLAAYMIPKIFVPCRVLPQTPSGKTDRKKLRTLGESLSESLVTSQHPRPTGSTSSEAVQFTPIEKTLREIWSKVLRIPESSIQPDDDFFKLGGDSIAAIRVVAACRSAKLHINVATIFQKAMLRDMAQVCRTPKKALKDHHQPFDLMDPAELDEILEEAYFECDVNRGAIEDLYPCTSMQEGLMAANMTRPGAYTARFVHKLPKDVDIMKFKKVWEEIYATTPVLRTRFISTSAARSFQAVIKERVEWQSARDLEDFLQKDEEKFMLPGTALTRFAIVTSSDQTIHFVLTMNHMIYDGWSISLLLARFNALYKDLKPKKVEDFRKFIEYTQKQDLEESARFWQQELAGVAPSTFPVPMKAGYQSIARAVIRDSITLPTTSASGLTISTLVRAAWALMIGHYSKTDDVLFGAVVSGRSTSLENIEDIDGPTIATVPVRVRLSPDQSVIDFLRYVQSNSISAIAHEQMGIQRIRAIDEDAKRACNFQNLLVVQFAGEWEESDILSKPMYREEFTTLPVTCEARLKPDGIEFATHVDELATSRTAVAQAISVVKTILAQLISISGSSPQRLCDITFDELPREVPGSISKSTMPQVVRSRIHDLITRTTESYPDREAICTSRGTIRYRDLDRLSTRLARNLIDQGLRAGSMVPLCFEKSVWAIVAMLGVLKADAAFVPLNPEQPLTRLRGIVNDVNAQFILTSAFHAKATNLGDVKHVVVDQFSLDNMSSLTHVRDSTRSTPDDIAYVIFTSGSTGTPKGVMISHSAYASSAAAHAEGHMLCPGSRVLQFATYCFDASLVEILTTLIQGGTVCVPSEKERIEELSYFMNQTRVDFAVLTPSVAKLTDPKDVPTLKTLVLAGEAADDSLVGKWLDAGVQIVNGYGPSECAVVAANQTLTRGMSSRNIGHAVGGRAWVVDPDDHNQLVPDGQTGELLMEGPTLATGYLNDPEKTAKSFIYDPIWSKTSTSSSSPRRMYKTGDLVQRNTDGTMIYIGRKDHQVKVNGQRIELGEIEHHLARCQGVKRSIIVFPSTGAFQQQITAVVELASPRDDITRVKEELSTRVATIMQPKQWVDIKKISDQQIPLLSSGKIDRRRVCSLLQEISVLELQNLEAAQTPDSEGRVICAGEEPAWTLAKMVYSMLPANNLAQTQAEFHDVLLPTSGLDSLNMISLIHFVSKRYRVKPTMQFLMDKNTSIRQLAAFISRSSSIAVQQDSTDSTITLDVMAEINKHDANIRAIQDEYRLANSKIASSRNVTTNGTGISQLRRAITSRISRSPNRYNRGGKLLTVLVTGATGFLGTQILRQLLERRDVLRVVAIVRADDAKSGLTRTIDAAQRARWWTALHNEKLEIWLGDLAKPRLGLDPLRWEILSGSTFDAVIHSGATVHWNKSYAEMEAVNVLSTVDLLQICVANDRPRFVYVSGGRQWQSEVEVDEDVAKEISESIGYSQTKFVSEVLSKRAAERCEPDACNIAVVKPGLIIGTPREGIANTDDFLWRMTAACIAIGSYNESEANSWLHVSDATTTAGLVIDAAVNTAPDEHPVCHVTDGMTWGTFWSIVRSMGYPLTPKSRSQWSSAIHQDLEARREQHPLWPLSHMLEGAETESPSAEKASVPEVPPLHLRMAVMKNVEVLANIGFLPPLPPQENSIKTTEVPVKMPIKAFSRSKWQRTKV